MDKLVFIGDPDRFRSDRSEGRRLRYARLIEQADRYDTMVLPDTPPAESTTYMGIAIMNLALAFRLSGKGKYLENAKRFMDTVVSYEKWGNAHLVNVDLSASWILFGLSLGYDWLKPYLGREEKDRIAKKIRQHAEIIYRYRRDTYGKGWSTNFFQNHNWINMTGLAAAGYVLQEECMEGRMYTEEAAENFRRVFSYLPDDGSDYEGVTYWRYGGMWLFVYAHLLKTQGGEDYFKTSAYLKNTFYYRLYQSDGDFKKQLNFGDCHDRHSSHVPCVYYKVAAEYRDGFAQKLGNLVTGEFLAEEDRESRVKPGILPEAAFEYIWFDPSVAEKDFSLLPKVRYFADLGLLSVREDWSRSSKVLSIKCGFPGGKKQWETGFRLLKEENISCLSLSHHHPDNLSYIFARGGDYLTCEDGYNRNIMPSDHNVILVDHKLTDAENVSDVYMESVGIRKKPGAVFDERKYGGRVLRFLSEGQTVLYRAETSGIYPEDFDMREVSRFFLTEGLKFWIFVDIVRSGKPHSFQLISNTDQKAEKTGERYCYQMEKEPLFYQVLSDGEIRTEQYEQEVKSIMTTQEPDKVCETHIETLSCETAVPGKSRIFCECFSFAGYPVKFFLEDRVLTAVTEEKKYTLHIEKETDAEPEQPVPIEVMITGKDGAGNRYRV